jgi:hypothetical protein
MERYRGQNSGMMSFLTRRTPSGLRPQSRFYRSGSIGTTEYSFHLATICTWSQAMTDGQSKPNVVTSSVVQMRTGSWNVTSVPAKNKRKPPSCIPN